LSALASGHRLDDAPLSRMQHLAYVQLVYNLCAYVQLDHREGIGRSAGERRMFVRQSSAKFVRTQEWRRTHETVTRKRAQTHTHKMGDIKPHRVVMLSADRGGGGRQIVHEA